MSELEKKEIIENDIFNLSDSDGLDIDLDLDEDLDLDDDSDDEPEESEPEEVSPLSVDPLDIADDTVQAKAPAKRGRKKKVIYAEINQGDVSALLSNVIRTSALDLKEYVRQTEEENEYQRKIHVEAVKRKVAEEKAEKIRKANEKKAKKNEGSIDDEDQVDFDVDTTDVESHPQENLYADINAPVEDPSFNDNDLFPDSEWSKLSNSSLIQNNSFKKAIRPVFRKAGTFVYLERLDIGEGHNPLERVHCMKQGDNFNNLRNSIAENCDMDIPVTVNVPFGGAFSNYESQMKIMITDDATYMYVKEKREYTNGTNEYIYAYGGGKSFLYDTIRDKEKLYGTALERRVEDIIKINDRSIEIELFNTQGRRNKNDRQDEMDINFNNEQNRINRIRENLQNITPIGINNGSLKLDNLMVINLSQEKQVNVLRDINNEADIASIFNPTPIASKVLIKLIDGKLCSMISENITNSITTEGEEKKVSSEYSIIFKPVNGSLLTATLFDIKIKSTNIFNEEFEYDKQITLDFLQNARTPDHIYEKLVAIVRMHTVNQNEDIDFQNRLNNEIIVLLDNTIDFDREHRPQNHEMVR